MELGLKGRSALVTGASKGTGLSIAQFLAAEGCALSIREGKLAKSAY